MAKKEKKPKLTKEEKQALKEQKKQDKLAQKEERKEQKKREKQEKRLAKLEAKAIKKGKKFDPNDPELEDAEGGTLLIAIVAFLIILVWLGIVAALIKLDVGGLGSTMFYPLLKDVPVINRILPGIDDELERQAEERAKKRAERKAQKEAEKAAKEAAKLAAEGEEGYQYDSMEDAVNRIKQLEKKLRKQRTLANDRLSQINDLQEQIAQLQTYKDNVDEFEKEKEKFYEEVVFSDEAPDISAYREYYESIEPDNAEEIYQKVIEQQQADTAIKNYATTYSTMDASEAAAIFDTMKGNMKLVARILDAMSVQDRSAILAAMDNENAAKLTELMEP